jgi:hypothetical protein
VDNIKMDLGEIGWWCMDWIDLVQDWDWRTLVNTVVNIGVPKKVWGSSCLATQLVVSQERLSFMNVVFAKNCSSSRTHWSSFPKLNWCLRGPVTEKCPIAFVDSYDKNLCFYIDSNCTLRHKDTFADRRSFLWTQKSTKNVNVCYVTYSPRVCSENYSRHSYFTEYKKLEEQSKCLYSREIMQFCNTLIFLSKEIFLYDTKY